MSDRRLYFWGAGIALLALAVCILVPWHIGAHAPEHGYLIAYGLSAAGTFTAAAVALLVATNDIRARREEHLDERKEAAEAQARLVVVQPSLGGSDNQATPILVNVNNFGSLAILDVLLIKIEIDGYTGPRPLGRKTLIPVIPANQNRRLSRRILHSSPSVPVGTSVVATVQFTDASGAWWEVSFEGFVQLQFQPEEIGSTQRVAFEEITPELGRSRLPGGSRWQEILDGVHDTGYAP